MATVYIAPTAQGSADGTSEANAYAIGSLSSAESDAGSGGTIFFLDGTYTTTVPTFASDGVTYKSLNLHGAKWQPSSYSYLQLSPGSVGITLSGFHFSDLRLNTSGSTGTNVMEFCKFAGTGNYTGHYISASGTPLDVNFCTFAATFSDSTEIIFRQQAGSTMNGCSVYVDPAGTVSAGGITVTFSGTVKNTIFLSTDSSKIGTTFASSTSNCCFHDFGSGNTSGGTNNIFADPQFVDPANGDLRLRPSSPCIGAATTS